MKLIILTQGKVATVDDEDYLWLSRHKWYASKFGNTWCAARKAPRKNSKHHTIWMHREILKPPQGMDTDHKDGDGLHNWRENLRVATHAQNIANARKTRGTSKYKGVSWHKTSRKWQVHIHPNGKHIHLGLFDIEEAAARAYDAAARKYFGEFARMNFDSRLLGGSFLPTILGEPNDLGI